MTYEYRLRIWRTLPDRDVVEFEEIERDLAPPRMHRLLHQEGVNTVTLQRREAGWGWEDEAVTW